MFGDGKTSLKNTCAYTYCRVGGGASRMGAGYARHATSWVHPRGFVSRWIHVSGTRCRWAPAQVIIARFGSEERNH